MVDVNEILDGLYKDQDFIGVQKLMRFFEGKEIDQKVLDTEDDFEGILKMHIGEKSGWNKSTITPIKEKLEDWLKSCERCRGVKFNNELITKYINLAGRFINYLDGIDKTKPHKSYSKGNSDIKTFEDLFVKEEKGKIKSYLKILQSTELPGRCKQLVNSAGKWIGNKQAAVLFYRVLLDNEIVRKITDTMLGQLLEAKFLGLDKSVSGKDPGPTANDYKDFFIIEITKVKNTG